MIVGNKQFNRLEEVALILILYSNVCLYNLNTQNIFIALNVIAGVFVLLNRNLKKVKITKSFIWISSVFALYIIYGVLFLRAGSFNIDRFIISYYQCLLLYLIFGDLMSHSNYIKMFAYCFGMVALLCIITMYINEGSFIGRSMRSVGSSLSGNVNTVGMSLGIMSLFMVYYYGKTKKAWILVFSVIVMGIMLLTGSKKTIVYIIANVFILYSFSKNKKFGIIIMISLFAILAYFVFGVDYFYNMIGSRIIDMLGQMGFHIKNAKYSHSTEVRMYMIREAFDMWLQNPIFGGGTNYFLANTITEYGYSHCNVTELLCSYGIVGFILYYIPHLTFLRSYKRIALSDKNIADFGLIVTVMALLIDWMVVTYSSFSTMYIPIILGMVVREKKIKMNNS